MQVHKKTRMRQMLVAAGAGLLLAQSLAYGHTYPTNKCLNPSPGDFFCEPDDKSHKYCLSGMTMGWPLQTAINYAHGTVVDMVQYADCPTWIDVQFKSETTGGNNLGEYFCQAFNSAGECERALLRVDPWKTINMSQGDVALIWLHEIGHSLGLSHADGAAMQNPLGTYANNFFYSAHQRSTDLPKIQ